MCIMFFTLPSVFIMGTDINYIRTLLCIINNFISSKSYFQFLLAHCQQVIRHGLQTKKVNIINNKNVKHKQIVLYYFITFLFFVFDQFLLLRLDVSCQYLPMCFIQIYRRVIKTMKYLCIIINLIDSVSRIKISYSQIPFKSFLILFISTFFM